MKVKFSNQARTQGTFEVEALLGRGFGGHLEAPNGSRGKLMDFTHLQCIFYVKNDPLLNF